MTYEILRVDHEPGLDVAFVRAWDEDGVPLGFGADGSCEIERIRLVHPVGRLPGVTLDIDAEVARTVRLVGKRGAKPVPGKTANTTTVVRPAAGAASPVDGYMAIGGADDTFANVRASSGNASPVTDAESEGPALQGSTTSNQFQVLRRSVYGFDTSAIPDTDTISAATLQLFGNGTKTIGLGDTNLGITTFTPASSSDLADTDFAVANFGGTDLATRMAINATWNSAAFNDFALNASGIAAINVTGNTFFALRLAWDIDNSFGGAWSSAAWTRVGTYFADQTGTTNDPVLTIEHASTATTPVIFEFAVG